jgi:RimJ/RimL family protein N-acetyltransferase
MQRDDAADVVRMRAEPEVEAQLFSQRPPTIDEHLRWLADVDVRGDRHEFMIVERTSGRSVGTIGLSRIEPLHRRAEYGVLIGEPGARGKGLASEASRLLLDYACTCMYSPTTKRPSGCTSGSGSCKRDSCDAMCTSRAGSATSSSWR